MTILEAAGVLQIVKSIDQTGGVERVAFELQRHWRQAGVKCRVLTASASKEVNSCEIKYVVPWMARLPTRGRGCHLVLSFTVPLFTLAAERRKRALKHRGIVISHGDALTGDICIIHAVNAASLAEKKRARNKLWRFNPLNYWAMLRDFYAIGNLQFQFYVAVSYRIKTELERFYNVPSNRILIIPNGVDVNHFKPSQRYRSNVRRELAVPIDAPVLLFVGHEFKRKGLADVIKAMPHLPHETRLLVVGSDNSGPFRRLAKAVAIDPTRILFLGARSDLSRIYPAADAFVFPTYYEAFGLVCMEAMASGLPVFATKVGGIEDYLVDGTNGYFIEHDGKNIAERLCPVLSDPVLRMRLGQEARRTAEQYAWPRIAAMYLDLLRTIALA